MTEPTPQSPVPTYQSPVPTPQSTVPTPQSPVPGQTWKPPAVFVPALVQPKRKGNRGFGFVIALCATIVFGGVYGVVVALIGGALSGSASLDFLASSRFYLPIGLFFFGFVILVLVANRAGLWVYVFGSLVVGALIYLGTISVLLLADGVIEKTPRVAGGLLEQALSNPFIVAAALLGREVSLWLGCAVAAHGRRVKARNAQALDNYEAHLAAAHLTNE